MSEERKGLAYGASAYILWGIFPLYFPLLKPAGTIEILAERMVWSLVLMVIVLRVGGGFAGVRRVLADRRQFGLLAAAAVLVSVNWGTYIFGVNTGHVIETSLGYFINPLLTILLGVVVLKERLRRAQWVAVAIGVVAVAVIAVDYGRPPWIALVLAVLVRACTASARSRRTSAPSSRWRSRPASSSSRPRSRSPSSPPTATWCSARRLVKSLLLAGTGVITVIPLLLFASGTRRLPLSVVGLLQYLAPVLQFAVGVGIRHEPLPAAELAGFCLVWLALIVLTVDGLGHQRSTRKLARAAESVSV